MRILIILVLVILSGCNSGTQQIAKAANDTKAAVAAMDQSLDIIQGNAESSKTRFENHEDPAGVEEQEIILEESNEIQEQSAAITKAADDVTLALPKVENKIGWFENLMDNLRLFFIFGIIVGVVVLAIYLGVGKLFRPILAMLGLIPKSIVRRAAMQDKMINNLESMTPREVVASERAADPMYEAARKRFKKKEKRYVRNS